MCRSHAVILSFSISNAAVEYFGQPLPFSKYKIYLG